MDPFLELLASHRTIRAFTEAPVSDEVVRSCVGAAQMAATSSNVQGYGILQVTDPTTRGALAECTGGQSQVAEAGAFFAICADHRRFRLMAEDRGTSFTPNLESFLVCAIDAALFAQNLVLAFEAQGLGTCYIGGLRNDLSRVRELLEVPLDVFPLFGLCVGEIAEDPGPKPRLPVDGVLFQDRFPTDDQVREHIAEYDERMAAYYSDRGLPGRDWSGGAHRKFKTALRAHLHEFYTSQGARLE